MKSPQPATVSRTSVVQALGSVSLPDREMDSFMQALVQPHPSVLRFRRDVDLHGFPFSTEPIPWYALARRLCDAKIQASRILAYACGDYFLQDAGSLLALAACDADQDLPEKRSKTKLICDLCAAPGGKATALLEMLGEDGFLVANDPIRPRIGPLSYNLARSGSDRYAVTSIDPDLLADHLPGVFDLVLVDAPCSGQALLSRGRQTTAAMSQRQIVHSAARQRRILAAAIRLLRPGGQLVYSTCTFAEAENEQQIDELCRQGTTQPLPVDRLAAYASATGCYRLWPHRHACAGSFAASLRLVVGARADMPVKRSWKRKHSDRAPAEAQQWFSLAAEPLRLESRDAAVFAWPADAPAWIDELAIAGPELMHRTGQTWKPSHAAALRRVGRAECLQSIEVDQETAQAFLSGQPIACRASGWHVVRYQRRPLGWVKSSQGIGKNQLPAAARMMGPWLC